METIDRMLAYRNRTLRTWPGKLLLGPTGRRLFADYVDKVPGMWGRIDFIHKLNLPGLFRVDEEKCPEQMERAETIWYPSHLHMELKTERFTFEEDKFITWEDVAVAVQRWHNCTAQPLRLRLTLCQGLNFLSVGEGATFEWDAPTHHLTLVGAVEANNSIVKDGVVLVPSYGDLNLTIAAAVDVRGTDKCILQRRAAEWARMPQPLLTQERAYASWFDDVPIFDCDDPLYTVTWYYRWYILRNTYVEPGVGAFQHGTFYEGRSHKVVKDEYAPWGHEFTQMIPLSTPMHVTDARWKADGSACQEALYTLLDSMDEDGIFRTMMLDRFSFPFGNFSEWALYGYYLLHPDRDFIRKTLPGFKKNVQGICKLYTDGTDDLPIAYNHRRTGKEYQPSFWYFRGYPDDARSETGYDWLKRVDLAIYLYLNARGVEKLCASVKDEDEVLFRELADRLQQEILDLMWDEETGFFYDLHYATGEQARVKSVVGVYPLWAAITGPEHLRVIETLLDPQQFYTGSGLASISAMCPAFMPQGSWKGQFLKGRDGCMWDGPSWPYTTCIALDTIACQSKQYDHRYDADFTRLLRQYSWQHYRNQSLTQPYLVEHYNAVTGEMLSDDVDYNHSFYIDLIVRHICGLEPVSGGFEIDPVDVGLEWFSLERVSIAGHEVSLHYRRGDTFRVYLDGSLVMDEPKLCRGSIRFKGEENAV